jgi:poly(A) polymerase
LTTPAAARLRCDAVQIPEERRNARDYVAASEVVERLRGAGFEAWFAGGCVRDLLTGKTPKDFDVATSAKPEETEALFRRTIAVGKAFGVVRVERRGLWFEVATFRKDGPYADGRRPDSIAFSSAAEDAARRDFTINALFMDPATGAVVDHVDGLKDVEARVVRCVGNADERFREDALRLLRAVRFGSAATYRLDPETLAAIARRTNGLFGVAPERLREEAEKIAARTAPERRKAVDLLFETGLIRDVFGDDAPKDSGEAARIVGATDRPGLPLFLAGLTLATIERETNATFARARAESVARRLKLSNEERASFVALATERRRLTGLHRATAARRRLWATRVDLDDHVSLTRAVGDAPEALEALRLETAAAPKRAPPLLDGGALMAMGARKGPSLGRLMRRLRILELGGRVATLKEAEAAARAALSRASPDSKV